MEKPLHSALVFGILPISLSDIFHAGVAELADALDSKSGIRKCVWVRAPPPVEFGRPIPRPLCLIR